MTGGVYRYHFADRPTRGVDRDDVVLSSRNFREGEQRFIGLSGMAGAPPIWAQDLLRVARVAHLVDRLALREPAPDGWTRTLAVRLELIDPAPWRAQLGVLADLLSTLTSDRWEVNVVPGAVEHPAAFVLVPAGSITEVALFSGGLDSLAYAAGRASAGVEGLVLVGRYDSDKEQQQLVYDVVRGIRPSVVLRQFWQQEQPDPDEADLDVESTRAWEPSTRSRGLLFIAAAVYAAAAHGVPVVAIPENGQLAVNPPLAADRVGACSSRSAHPWTLHLINRLIRGVAGARAAVEVVNPLVEETKAGVCRLARNAGLGPDVLAAAVSCGHSPRKRGNRPDHCGHCYPCLVRRAGLWEALDGGDRTEYETDPWTTRATETTRADLFALLHWLSLDFTALDLIADLPLPADTSVPALLDVIDQGRAELRAYLSAMVPAESGLAFSDCGDRRGR